MITFQVKTFDNNQKSSFLMVALMYKNQRRSQDCLSAALT